MGLVGFGAILVGDGIVESWNLAFPRLGRAPLLEAIVSLLVGLAGLSEPYSAH